MGNWKKSTHVQAPRSPAFGVSLLWHTVLTVLRPRRSATGAWRTWRCTWSELKWVSGHLWDYQRGMNICKAKQKHTKYLDLNYNHHSWTLADCDANPHIYIYVCSWLKMPWSPNRVRASIKNIPGLWRFNVWDLLVWVALLNLGKKPPICDGVCTIYILYIDWTIFDCIFALSSILQ